MNNFTHDSRVLKEAMTLIEAGYHVTVMAQLDDKTVPYENKNGLEIKRLPMNPFHIRAIRWTRQLIAAPKKIVAVPRKVIQKITSMVYEAVMTSVYGTMMKFLDKNTRLKQYDSFGDFATENKWTASYLIIVGPFVLIKQIFGIIRIIISGLIRLFYLLIERPLVLSYTWVTTKSISYPINWILKYHRTLVILDFNYKLYKQSKNESYKFYHAHDLNTLLGAYYSAKRDGAKLIYDSHELYLERNRFQPYSRFGKWLRRKVEGFLIKKADASITVNQSIAERLSVTYDVTMPVILMNTPQLNHHEYTAGNVSLRDAIGVNSNLSILLYIGAITFNRGLENVIRAMALLPDCFFISMGYGADSYKQKLSGLAKEQGVDSRFAFFGPVPSDQVVQYASSADIGIAPIENVCLSYYFCSPNKLFEYLQAGLPVVTSNFPELERVVSSYDIGRTFDPSKPEEIAEAILSIMTNRSKWSHMGDITGTIASTYNWENESKKLLALYHDLSLNTSQ